MSRVGKSPVPIPDKTTVEISGSHIKVAGPKGVLERDLHPDITVAVDGSQVVVTRSTDQKKHRALHGLSRALVANMVEGVSKGFERNLKIIGIGYRAEMKGDRLMLYLGYSHPIVFMAPEGVKMEVIPKENKIIVSGIDKELVGLTAAKIRSFRKPEPYKGKGVRYEDEQVQIKAGKTAGSGG